MTSKQRPLLFLIAIVGVVPSGGCRAPRPEIVASPSSAVSLFAPSVDPPISAVTPLEPDYSRLPLLDPMTVGKNALPVPAVRGISEETCRRLARERVPLANVLAHENGVPRVEMVDRKSPRTVSESDELLREVREFAATEARNRAVGEAGSAFFQLADAQGRGEILKLSLDALDEARKTALEAKMRGAIVDLGELDRQRATVLAVIGQADLGALLLDTDLRRRLGVISKDNERLRPAGDFGISGAKVDVDAAVTAALQKRGDLLAMRTLYLKLNPENLSGVREYLRGLPTAAGLIGIGPRLPIAHRASLKQLDYATSVISTAAEMEVEIRRQQLWTLIEERERGVADEVRATAATLIEQTRQVGLARWRAEQLMNRATEVVKDKGMFVGLPARAEALRARSEVVGAVMVWHQARVKFQVAQGVYAE